MTHAPAKVSDPWCHDGDTFIVEVSHEPHWSEQEWQDAYDRAYAQAQATFPPNC